MIHHETICAISTPAGVGGIAVIRISGSRAIELASQHLVCKGKPLMERATHTAVFGEWTVDGEALDEVVATLFRGPRSFTGEDTVEVSCHGSRYIQQEVLASLIASGCRMATHGEFTQRAFLNGRMDLSQAEAVADLIASHSAASHRLALQQLKGGFSAELGALREEMLTLASLVELELDFSEEEVEFADRTQLMTLTTTIEQILARLASSFRLGNAIKNGIPVALVGETNAGKSTMLNLLLGEERAIVSDIHGTTRDTIEETFTIEGHLFRFIDTAGIRHTTDTIEAIGIERTYQKIEQSSVVLWLIDVSLPEAGYQQLAVDMLARCANRQLIVVLNKRDKATAEQLAAAEAFFASLGTGADASAGVAEVAAPADGSALNVTTAANYDDAAPAVSQPIVTLALSAKRDSDATALAPHLLRAAGVEQLAQGDIIVTNARHYEALTLALAAIRRVDEGLHSPLPTDLLAQEIREAIHHLSSITGDITPQDILTTIFSRFCIGK